MDDSLDKRMKTFLQSINYFFKGDYQSSLETLGEATDDVDIMFWKCMNLIKLQKLEEVKNILDSMIFDKYEVMNTFLQGIYAENMGEDEKAVYYLEKLKGNIDEFTPIDPSLRILHEYQKSIGMAFQNIRLWQEAIKQYQIYLQAYPDDQAILVKLLQCQIKIKDDKNSMITLERINSLNEVDLGKFKMVIKKLS